MTNNIEQEKIAMDYPNIKINYQDTPEKFRKAADEIISYLIENLLVLNKIEEECSQLNEYQKRGIRIKGKPKDFDGIWTLYRTRYGEAVSSFCTDKLVARGYAQSMRGPRRVVAPDGTLIEEKIYGKYAYLNYGCELTITMKSNKRAVVEISYVDKDHLNRLRCFTLVNNDKWQLTDIKHKFHEDDKWKSDNL